MSNSITKGMHSRFVVALSRVVLVAYIASLAGCAGTGWLTDAAINAKEKSPEELIRQLGPPAKIVYNQRLPLHKGRTQEYRYYVLNRSGRAEVRRYFYDGQEWLTEIFPAPETDAGDHFKIIDPASDDYREQLNRLWKLRPDLKP